MFLEITGFSYFLSLLTAVTLAQLCLSTSQEQGREYLFGLIISEGWLTLSTWAEHHDGSSMWPRTEPDILGSQEGGNEEQNPEVLPQLPTSFLLQHSQSFPKIVPLTGYQVFKTLACGGIFYIENINHLNFLLKEHAMSVPTRVIRASLSLSPSCFLPCSAVVSNSLSRCFTYSQVLLLAHS